MNAAFIPVRGGSKSIPLKNIRNIAGQPLVYWVTRAANECKYIDIIYVATDSEEIGEVVKSFHFSKVQVINRGNDTATDTATTESAMIEFANNYDFDNIVLIQATSPLLKCEDLEGGFELFNSYGTDSVLSVVRQKRFCWNVDESGFAKPINYDYYSRPRRQEFNGYLVENGAFYITSKKMLLESQNRISGNIRSYEMDESTYYEIDEPSDWLIIEQQLLRRNRRKIFLNVPRIAMFLTDCDGVLTDGGMYYSENGDELKKFNTKDGYGLRLLKNKGIITGIITGEDKELNKRRAKKIGVDEIYSGVTNKVLVIEELCKKYNVSLDTVAYIGDDLNDMDAIKAVGFGCCVADGNEELKKIAKYVTSKRGGEGAVREVIDLIIGNCQ